jgi:subtilisin family serine protease
MSDSFSAINHTILKHVMEIIGKDSLIFDVKYNPDKKKLYFSMGDETFKISHKKFSDIDIQTKTQEWIKTLEKILKKSATQEPMAPSSVATSSLVVPSSVVTKPESVPVPDKDSEKWIITFKDNKKSDIKLRDIGVSSYKESNGSTFNGVFLNATQKQIKKIEKTYGKQIAFIEKDIKMNIAVVKDSLRIVGKRATNLTQTIGNFINRIGDHKSSRKAGTGVPLVPLSATTYAFVVDTGIDGSNNELNVDTLMSRNFVNGVTDEKWNDLHGHGTHVSGIIGAKDNSIGVVGTSPNAKVVAIRVLDENGSGYTSDIIRALEYIGNFKIANSSTNVVVNMSLGGGRSTSLDNAVKSLISKNVTVVVAAGNEGQDAKYVSPARVSEAITVGAYNPTNNQMASWSNYGAGLDLMAPGVNIDSTLPNGQYGVWSGTSMATPVVVGTIVSMLTTNPSVVTPANIRTKLFNDASSTTPTNYDSSAGSNQRITLTSRARRTNTVNRSVYVGRY